MKSLRAVEGQSAPTPKREAEQAWPSRYVVQCAQSDRGGTRCVVEGKSVHHLPGRFNSWQLTKAVMAHAPGDTTRGRDAPSYNTKTPNPFIPSPSDCLASTRVA